MGKLTMKEQVEQLSQEQWEKVLKIWKISTTIVCAISALILLWCILGMYLVFSPPVTMDVDYMKIGLGIIVGGLIGFGCILAVLLFIKIKFPYYSEAKAKYIKKLNKQSCHEQ